MDRFPYRPRAPRTPPEAPEPETPAQSDARFQRAMVRLAMGAILVGLLGTAIVGAGLLQPVAAALLVGFWVVFALVREFRVRVIRAWMWEEVTGVWWLFDFNDPVPPPERKRDMDPHRGDHLL